VCVCVCVCVCATSERDGAFVQDRFSSSHRCLQDSKSIAIIMREYIERTFAMSTFDEAN
jgi:hypothetical protein